MDTEGNGYRERVRRQMQHVLGKTLEWVNGAAYQALFHSPAKQEPWRADLVAISSRGIVISPASIFQDASVAIPLWAPEQNSVFAGEDGLFEACLWVQRHNAEPARFAVRKLRPFVFDIPSPEDRAAILALKTAVRTPPRAADADEETYTVNLEPWLRSASANLILALADTEWGSVGVLPEVCADIARHSAKAEERLFWERGATGAEPETCIQDVDPERVRAWLHKHRPGVYAIVVLVPYLFELHPFDACKHMDPHLLRAAQVCDPQFPVNAPTGRTVAEMARTLLEALPERALAPVVASVTAAGGGEAPQVGGTVIPFPGTKALR